MFEFLGNITEYLAVQADSLGFFGVLLFMAIFILAVLLFMPITPLSLTAGMIFGWWGIAVAYISAVTGSYIAFLIARRLGHDYVAKLSERWPLVRAIDQVAVKGDFRLILLIRLSGILPLAVQNYAFGSTSVHRGSYLVATLIGLIPGAVVKVWIGKTGIDVLSSDGLTNWVSALGLVCALVATVAMLVYAGTLATRELRAQGMLTGVDDAPTAKAG